MNRYKRENGDIAVLISPSYGAGWSTWNENIDPFDVDMIKILLEDDSIVTDPTKNVYENLKDIAKEKYPNAYLGGLDYAVVEWLSEGTRFYIDEYDGAEKIITADILVYTA